MKHWLIEHGVYVVLSLALCGAGVYFLMHLTHDADANSAALLVTQGKLDAVLDTMNRPCGTSQPCGTLADVAKTLNTIRMTSGTLEVAAAHENRNLDTLDKQEAQLAKKVNAAVDAVAGTANAASQTLHGASLTLSTMNDSLAATRPLIEASTATVRDYGALAPFLKSTADNVQHMTFHFDAIAGDGQKIADKETTDFLKPTRWYMVPVKRLGEIWDVTAAVARHAP